jgi:hypothetical protein
MSYEIKDIIKILKKEGCLHISNFLDNDILVEIENEFDLIFSKIPNYGEASLDNPSELVIQGNDYKFGKHLSLHSASYRYFPILMNNINTDFLKNIIYEYFGTLDQFCMQIFMSHDYNIASEKDFSRQNYLHFDPYESLKFFLYLTDTTKDSGATYYVPGSHSLGKNYRENKMNLNDASGVQGGVPHRLDDYEKEPQYTKKDAIPVLAKAGDLLILNTDVLHYGGVCKTNDHDRKLIIIHNRP